MAPTLKDIAAIAGVSVGTVDRALHDRGRVRPEVAERINAIAKQMNYKTNSVAKSLATRKRNLRFAVILHIMQNDFYNEVLLGVQKASDEIKDFGIHVDVYPCEDFNPEEQCRIIDKALEDGATALAIVPIDSPIVAEKLRILHENDVPVVFLSSLLPDVPCFSAVHCDYTRSGRIGGQLIDILSGGNGSVLVFTPTLSMFGHRQRMKGVEDFFVSRGHNIQIADIVTIPNDTIDSYRIICKALEQHPEANYALFCGNTKAWLHALRDTERKIVSVVYDQMSETRRALLDGRVAAVILQEPSIQGYETIMSLFRYFTSGIVPDKVILVDNQILLRECISTDD